MAIKKRVRLVEIYGERMPVGMAAEIAGVPRETFRKRLDDGANPLEPRQLSTRVVLQSDGPPMTLVAFGRGNGVSKQLLKARIRRGWDPLEAAKTAPIVRECPPVPGATLGVLTVVSIDRRLATYRCECGETFTRDWQGVARRHRDNPEKNIRCRHRP